ncbi:MAG: 4Fe-4S cluster-binding domain-containing protein [Acetobacter sp.]|nr:4Fe-4S cluster-binding domain-containing protein [Bacteroides sp.]MCM1340845.1 4Fe-4S cluster-binding domain-containing protein [Acetobacter sp.]MCM1432598.1 4Fe-4S cluster-binding domain-containing protein [Clostridiales bacterium]
MNVFSNPKYYIDTLLNNVKIPEEKKIQLCGKSFICVFFTKRCRAGCSFCFFKSNNNKLNDIQESYEMSKYGFEKFLKFVSDSNNGYLLISGGGEPFEKPQFVIETIKRAKTNQIVIVTNGIWAKDYEAAKTTINKLYNALKSRKELIPVTIRLSIDDCHYKQLGPDVSKNIIDVFERYYSNEKYFILKIHTIISDNAINKIAEENDYRIGDKIELNKSDNNKLFKLIPKKYKLWINNNYAIDVGAAKLFYPTIRPNLNDKHFNKKAINVFDTDITVSESSNPSRVTNIDSEDGFDFWINYNGNVTTWQNEQKESIYNIYVDNYYDVINNTYNNILSYSYLDKGHYYREGIINEVNNRAVIRSKLSNMRDCATALLLEESKTNLYYAIRVIKDYLSENVLSNDNLKLIPKELCNVINMDNENLILQYKNSDYCIIDQYIEENEFDELEWRDLFYLIRLNHFEVSEKKIKLGIDYFNSKTHNDYKTIDEIEIKNISLIDDRLIEKLTRMKAEAKRICKNEL